ncbi:MULTISPECIES: hypothetical protein [unclassified Mesobacillus]|uniref:hypothetical protein n=1 Tax=unclassified Mesobacillus TaxID=2675270 RepID=UPI0020423921|nr:MULTISPECIES: hypothetical protein [unclassified Mesobacillus]MCM3233552.1 hypothetical protein [Mesobacillus sp. MER 48]
MSGREGAIIKKYLIWLLIFIVLLTGCNADGGRVTARDVLKQNENADILKYDGFIYSNVTEHEWFEENKDRQQKGKKIGEIKKVTTSSLFFTNLSATKLPKGTVLFDTNDGETGIIFVETDNGDGLYYMQLLEG